MNLINYAAPLISFLSEQDEYNRQMDMAKLRQNMMNDLYQRQMDNATTAFNRSYYRNYLDNANSRNMLKRVREELGEQTKAARNRAVATGATGEAVAAVQKYNNRTLDNVVGSLAAAEEANKENVASLYDAQRQQLDNMMTTSTMKYFEDASALSKAMNDSRQQLLMGFGSQYMKRLEDFLRRQSGNDAWPEQSNDGGDYFSDENYMMS